MPPPPLQEDAAFEEQHPRGATGTFAAKDGEQKRVVARDRFGRPIKVTASREQQISDARLRAAYFRAMRQRDPRRMAYIQRAVEKRLTKRNPAMREDDIRLYRATQMFLVKHSLPLLRRVWGSKLKVVGKVNADVAAVLNQLVAFPPRLVGRLNDAGFQGIAVGQGSIPRLGNQDLAGKLVGEGREADSIGGIYRFDRRTATVSASWGEPATILHELGHAVDHLLGLRTSRVGDARSRDVPRLAPYFRTTAEGGSQESKDAAESEYFAEAVARYLIRGQKRFAKRWDADMATYLSGWL